MPEQYCVGPSMATDWGEDRKPEITWPLLRRVFSYFAPYRGHGLLAILCIAAAAALGLVPALVTKALIDYLTQRKGSLGGLALILGAGIVAGILGGLISVLQSYLRTTISEGIEYDLRRQLFDRLLQQSMGFYTNSRTGDLLSRMNNDVGGIEDVVSDTVFGLASNVFVVSSTVVLMFVLNWQITLAALVMLPLVLIPGRYVGRATYRARKRTQEKLSEMTSYMQEVLGISGILLVKAFTKERSERLRFGGINQEVRRLKIRQAMIGRWFGMLLNLVMVLGPALLLLLGGYLVLTGRTTLGTVVSLVVVLAGRLAGSAGSLGDLQVNIMGSLALFHRIFLYLDLPADVADAPNARELTDVRGAVAFQDVSFGYGATARTALEHVSFQVEPGTLTALVGPSGAGKTTVTYLLARFYDPQAGTIQLDGTDVKEVTLESLSRNIGIVYQDSFLFHASVRENLLYARPEATQAQIEAATRAAYIHDFIESLPEGYDTVVGERGHRLSGGEKQRIAIARVILKDPRIVILDEATSNLDTVSEQLIQAALRPLFAGRTSFVIAHRLSTVLAADLILVFEQGRLVERGTHSELLKLGGLYATHYRRQFLVDPGADEVALETAAAF